MFLEQDQDHRSLIDLFERVLEKGIVIDPWARLSLVRVDLATLKARVVVVIEPILESNPPPDRL